MTVKIYIERISLNLFYKNTCLYPDRYLPSFNILANFTRMEIEVKKYILKNPQEEQEKLKITSETDEDVL